MVFVFYHRLAFGAFNGARYLQGRLQRVATSGGCLSQAGASGLSATASMAAWGAEQSHLQLPWTEFRSKSSPNLAAKYSRSIRLCASFAFSRSQITPRV